MLRHYDKAEQKSEKIMVPVNQLTIGMHVVEIDRPWSETTFLFQGFVIGSAEELRDVQEQCEYVYVEVTREVLAQRKAGSGSNQRGDDPKRPPPGERIKWVKKVPIEKELTRARGTFDDARGFAKNALQAIRMGMELDVEQVKQAVHECVESLLNNQDAMLFLLQIKNKDEYTAQHSMNVGTMSAAFAMHLGHPQFEVEQIGLCGMLHDIGKVKVPDDILNKPDRLTDEEMAEMNNHTTYGRNILMAKSGLFRGAIDVAYAHHERLDGSGYPRKLVKHKIPYFAQVVGIVDTYDAITSARCYKPGSSPHKAIEILNKIKETHFKADLIEEFTNWMGIYPPGSLVELNTGEIAVVISVASEKDKLRPRVMVVTDAQQQQTKDEYVLNLDARPTAPDGQPYQVKRSLPTGSHGIDLGHLVERGVFGKSP